MNDASGSVQSQGLKSQRGGKQREKQERQPETPSSIEDGGEATSQGMWVAPERLDKARKLILSQSLQRKAAVQTPDSGPVRPTVDF